MSSDFCSFKIVIFLTSAESDTLRHATVADPNDAKRYFPALVQESNTFKTKMCDGKWVKTQCRGRKKHFFIHKPS